MLISVIVLGLLASLDPVRPVVFLLVLRTQLVNAIAFLAGWTLALSVLFGIVLLMFAGDTSTGPGTGQRTAASVVVARDRTGALGLVIGFGVFAVVSTAALLGILIYDIWRPESARLQFTGVVSTLEWHGPMIFTVLSAAGGSYLVVDGLRDLLR